jgi:hypothetical protein
VLVDGLAGRSLEHFGLVFARSAMLGREQGMAGLPRRIAAAGWPLRSLSLGGFDLDRDALAPLAADVFPQLVQLALHDCRLDLAALRSFAPSLRALEVLELDYDNDHPGTLDPNTLAALLGELPALRWLRIRGARLGYIHVYAIANSPHAAGLRRLDLTHEAIGTEGAQLLLDRMPQLAWLDVAHSQPEIDEPTRARLAAHRRAHITVEPPPVRYPPNVVEPIESGQKIAAIKEYRNALPNIGLLEAKLAIERFTDELGAWPRRLPRTSWIGA